jgi:sn-1 stearoyl-lipid 9-desaturase
MANKIEAYGKKAAQVHGYNWITAVFMGIYHVGAIAAVFFFSWQAAVAALFLWWVAGGWGIGMGYHRLLTHRGFKTSKWFEYFLTTCGALALEGGPIFWVATHRIHHQKSDKEGDPHTPRDGKWWAHMGWILTGQAMHHDSETLQRYVPDMAKDKFHIWMTKYHFTPQIVVGIALLIIGYAIGGWWMAASMVTWGVFLRTVVLLHCTWLVNSATHLWGSRRFQTRDDSTNLWWVALITFGEGWHNNHHAHPVSARHGIAWYEFDINWICITTCKWLGLIRDVKAVNVEGKFINQPALAQRDTTRPISITPVVTEAPEYAASGD